jgi:hypothetical protein
VGASLPPDTLPDPVAKKAKTPPPPRRVQAPKTRTDADGRRTRMLLYGLAASGAVALVVVLAIVFAGGGSGGSGKGVASAMTAANCTFKTVDAFIPKGGQTHVASLTRKLDWNTFPPSNGQHYPAWAVWGFYTDPVNPRMVVHNLEHGGIVLWWGPDTPKAQVDRLNQLYSDDPTGMFGTPLVGLGSKVAVSAWTGDPTRYGRDGYYGQGHVATCPSFDDATEKAFVAFRDAYRGKGPEGVPLSSDEPGMGPG